MGMKSEDVYKLMERFEASGLTRMVYKAGDTSLELERQSVATVSAASSEAAAPVQVASAPAPASVSEPALPVVTAPLVGTFYVAPSPDKPPFVQVGDHVKKGDTVCLLEAMKMMSDVPAPCDCIIEEIVAADGELVSFGAPLIRYREA